MSNIRTKCLVVFNYDPLCLESEIQTEITFTFHYLTLETWSKSELKSAIILFLPTQCVGFESELQIKYIHIFVID